MIIKLVEGSQEGQNRFKYLKAALLVEVVTWYQWYNSGNTTIRRSAGWVLKEKRFCIHTFLPANRDLEHYSGWIHYCSGIYPLRLFIDFLTPVLSGKQDLAVLPSGSVLMRKQKPRPSALRSLYLYPFAG